MESQYLCFGVLERHPPTTTNTTTTTSTTHSPGQDRHVGDGCRKGTIRCWSLLIIIVLIVIIIKIILITIICSNDSNNSRNNAANKNGKKMMILMILTFGSQLFQHCVNNDVGASSPNLMKLMMIFSFMIAIMVMMTLTTLTKATGTTMTTLTPALQWTTRGPSDSGQAPDDFLMKDSTCLIMIIMMTMAPALWWSWLWCSWWT